AGMAGQGTTRGRDERYHSRNPERDDQGKSGHPCRGVRYTETGPGIRGRPAWDTEPWLPDGEHVAHGPGAGYRFPDHERIQRSRPERRKENPEDPGAYGDILCRQARVSGSTT